MVTFEGGKAVGNARDLNSWSMVYQHQYTLLRSWVLLGLGKITLSVIRNSRSKPVRALTVGIHASEGLSDEASWSTLGIHSYAR